MLNTGYFNLSGFHQILFKKDWNKIERFHIRDMMWLLKYEALKLVLLWKILAYSKYKKYLMIHKM